MDERKRSTLSRVAQIKLSYRNRVPAEERLKVTSSKDAADILRDLWDQNRIDLLEEFRVLFLDTRMTCLGFMEASIGGITGTVVDLRLILTAALKSRCNSILIAHNHPSGITSPSAGDIELTKRMAAGSKLLDLNLADHIILTSNGYYSFADAGLIP